MLLEAYLSQASFMNNFGSIVFRRWWLGTFFFWWDKSGLRFPLKCRCNLNILNKILMSSKIENLVILIILSSRFFLCVVIFSKQIMRLRFWLSHLTDQNLIASSKFYGWSTTSQRFLASVFPESFACQSFINVKESKVVINLNKKSGLLRP